MVTEPVRNLEIVSFERYQGRKDVDRPSWFRLQNSLASDPQFFTFDSDEKWFLICLFCLASIKNKGTISLANTALAAYARISTEKVISAIEKLIAIGTLREHLIDVTSTQRPRNARVRTERQRDRDNRETEISAVALPKLAVIWNLHRGTLAEVRGCSGTRRGKVEARWKETPDESYWVKIVQRIAKSPFCTGDNDRGWLASFDFLIQPETRHKVDEGKYDPRSHGPRGPNGGGPAMSAEVKAELADLELKRRALAEGRL